MSAVADAARVRLKRHVYFGPVADGVLFDAGDASFVIKDPATLPLLGKLVALLDAGEPAERILERAPEKLATFYRKVLASLAEHDMLLAVDDEAPPDGSTDALRAFLEDRLAGHRVDAALRRWRETSVVVMGGGHALVSTARALAESGCTKLTLLLDEAPAVAPRFDTAHALRLRTGHVAEDAASIDDAGLVVYAADAADPDSAARVEALLRTRAIAGAIGGVFAGHACVLPAALPGRPGLVDLLHWLPAKDVDTVEPHTLSLLGSVIAQAAIARFFGIEPAASRGQVAVVAAGPAVEYRMLVASAAGDGAPLPFAHASKYELPENRALLPFEQAKIALEPWFDPLLGPFGVVADDAIEQMPMLQYPLRVRSAQRGGAETRVVGWGAEHADGVLRGLAAAVEALAQSFLPERVPLACAFDEDRWKQRALAMAVVGSDEWARTQRWAWVGLDQLPTAQAQLLLGLVRFHAIEPLRMQLLWAPCGEAFATRVLHGDEMIAGAIAGDAHAAIEEGLGRACSAFQMPARASATSDDVPAPAVATPVDDWREAFAAANTGGTRDADFHLFAAPGFPPTVYCGHATLKTSRA
jgi:hypothetical protein